MFMILCVIDQPDKLNSVLDAWKAIGVTGVTIIESSGLHRQRSMPHIPMRYGFAESNTERGNITLYTVVEEEVTIQSCLSATEQVIGDLNNSNTGIFIAWPLSFAKGVSGKHPYEGKSGGGG